MSKFRLIAVLVAQSHQPIRNFDSKDIDAKKGICYFKQAIKNH